MRGPEFAGNALFIRLFVYCGTIGNLGLPHRFLIRARKQAVSQCLVSCPIL